MANDNGGAGHLCPQETSDPRTRISQECFFTARPEPLEAWLWKAKVPASAERVFWLHWREGLRNRDWCSSVPISQVAARCLMDESTVTRAYQILARLGLLRRTDPGRDPRNPFNQATAVTEVFLPRALVQDLHALPKRAKAAARATTPVASPTPAASPAAPTADTPKESKPHVSWKERRKEMASWESAMSEKERSNFRDSMYRRLPGMTFDAETTVSEDIRKAILAYLGALVASSAAKAAPTLTAPPAASNGPRKLTLFELARLRRELQKTASTSDVAELTRQVLWAVEQGALLKLPSAKALNVALKKIREGAWTRPHRMPPNWTRSIAAPETCGAA